MLFSNLTDPQSPVFNVPGYPQTLFPEDENLTDEMKENIKDHYLRMHINMVPPWMWIRHFHLIIRQHAYQWRKLIESEKALRDEDGIFNYDLTEESSSEGSYRNSSTGSSSGENEAFTSDTPDGSLEDISNYMSSGSRASNSGESEGESTGNSFGNGHLRRYGNIGVMTSAQILGGYREAIDYNAYETIWRELDPLFIGIYDDDFDDGTMYASTDNWKGW